MKRFAKTVVKVLTEYSMVLQNDFQNHVRDESKVKLNNGKFRFWNIKKIIRFVIIKFDTNIISDNFKACVLMNNIQQTRVQLEKTYQAMGGQELEEDAASILNQMQTRLNGVLDNLARVFATR